MNATQRVPHHLRPVQKIKSFIANNDFDDFHICANLLQYETSFRIVDAKKYTL